MPLMYSIYIFVGTSSQGSFPNDLPLPLARQGIFGWGTLSESVRECYRHAEACERQAAFQGDRVTAKPNRLCLLNGRQQLSCDICGLT
jgi:hypothetical protein